MKRQTVTLFAAAMVAVLCLAAAPAARADDVSRGQTDANNMMHKLGRGFVNLFTGIVEIPKNVAREWKKTDPFTGLIVGTVKGVGWGWARTMTGAYDILTFPFPVPEGYVPLMEPEFVLTDIWGDPIPEVTEFPEWH